MKPVIIISIAFVLLVPLAVFAQLIPEPTPEIIPEPTPKLIPEPTPEPTPKLIPELIPEPSPEPISEPEPELTEPKSRQLLQVSHFLFTILLF